MGLTEDSRARLEVSGEPGRLVVTLAGELDLASLQALTAPLELLLGAEPQPVVLDMGGLSFLDSSGVAVLVRIANHFGQVRTRATTTPVRRVIEVLGLAERLGMGEA
jgi:anti-anti-sigma factor